MKKFCTLALFCSASYLLPTHAVAQSLNVPLILDPLSVKSVRVLLAPTGLLTRSAWSEENLERGVCAKVTSNPAAISSLVKVLGDFSPALTTLPITRLRGAVYLTLDDGSEVKLLMDDKGFKADTRVVSVYGYPGTESLLVTALDYQILVNWAKSTVNDAGYKERKDLTCAY